MMLIMYTFKFRLYKFDWNGKQIFSELATIHFSVIVQVDRILLKFTFQIRTQRRSVPASLFPRWVVLVRGISQDKPTPNARTL